MTKRRAKDVAASVRARLQTNAMDTSRPFQEVLQYFAIERLLYRLSQSPHAEKFVLKGGLMLTAWRAPSSRPTRDIDFLAKMPSNVTSVLEVVREICEQEVEPDGLEFHAASLEGRIIKEDADYEGVALTPDFASDPAKQTQWSGFCRKSRIDFAPETLQEVCDTIALFIQPVAMAVDSRQPFVDLRMAPGPWRSE